MSTDTPTLSTETRTKLGTRYNRRLRSAGRLPAVVYGHGHDPMHVSVDTRAFHAILDHHSHLVEVNVDGKPQPCLIKDVQYDHLDRDPVHADFAIVNLDEEIEIELEIVLKGEPAGLSEDGAALSQPMNTIVVKTKANNIPESITQDVSAMNVGDQVHVGELTFPDGVSTDVEDDLLVCQVVIRQEQPDPEPVDELEEPGVIGEGEEPGPEEAGSSD
ncbi:50S ribosomal protein L25 [Phycisphaera mikurensis]|uniref:Large ribosomal subunit protein bL25 n=2 Tax=Phycisphaera TaxID=666508 RepID=I0IHQ6_PHYMF|nr:50S ribosomal protein L25 [Phycisphaera mikurensis]BAM04794.1 50S ribosomal protein L25 [Phycisphaera mikurensis NBRC 102666]